MVYGGTLKVVLVLPEIPAVDQLHCRICHGYIRRRERRRRHPRRHDEFFAGFFLHTSIRLHHSQQPLPGQWVPSDGSHRRVVPDSLVEIVFLSQGVQVLGDVFATDIFLSCRGTVFERVRRDLESANGVVGHHTTIDAGARPSSAEVGAGLQDEEGMGRVDGEVGLCGNEAKPTCRVLEIGAETGGRVAGTLPAPTIITFGMTYVGWLLVGIYQTD